MDAARTTDLPSVAAPIAAAIGEPARARMLYLLMDGHARTSTELALAAGVAPATASAHLNRLRAEHLVRVEVQGKHRYYALAGSDVATVLESLSVLAGDARAAFVPNTPSHLRDARTCYDHVAGTLGVAIHDRLTALGWLRVSARGGTLYEVTDRGSLGLASLGIDVDGMRSVRRRLAFGCLDWSERRAHVGGALGAALLALALEKKWLTHDRNSRRLELTGLGRRALLARLGVRA